MKKSVLIFIMVLIITSLWNIKVNAQDGPPSEKELLPPPSKYLGLQLGSEQLFKGLKKYDSTLVFSADKLSGKQVLVTHGVNNSIVEVIGTEKNLRKVTYTVSISPGDKDMIRSDFYILGNVIATVIPRKELQSWFLGRYTSVNSYPSVPFTETTSINLNKLTCTYQPDKKVMALTIEAE